MVLRAHATGDAGEVMANTLKGMLAQRGVGTARLVVVSAAAADEHPPPAREETGVTGDGYGWP